MSSNSSGKKLEGFFTGKGFYIVLFLCAAVIGVSAWMMAAGNETMAENVTSVSSSKLENKRVETVVVPPQAVQPVEEMFDAPEAEEPDAPAVNDGGLADTTAQAEDEMTQVWNEENSVPVSAPVYTWPVTGELDRGHSLDALKYDETMRDWRTHNGVDVAAPLGAAVTASRAGTVQSVVSDDLYGTVVTIDHGDGSRAVYANLDSEPAVSAGDWVESGAVIGSVGSTALCEIGQSAHLHFALTVDGVSVDPMNYLSA